MLHKHESLSLNPQHPLKRKAGMVTRACRTGILARGMASLAKTQNSMTACSRFSERLSENKVESNYRRGVCVHDRHRRQNRR